jgi:hypothetical protein
MDQFKIFAHGESFEVDVFLATTTILPDFIWRRGDQKQHSCVESKHSTSGIEILLGDGRAVPFLEQEGIAIEYLKAHRDELRALAAFSGVETFILGLQYNIELDETLTGFCMGPSASLM